MLELLQHPWAISERYYNAMYPLLSHRLQNGTLEGLIKKKTLEDYFPVIEALLNADMAFPNVHADEVTFSRDQQSSLPVARTNNQNIAIIPIIGPLTKYGDLCSPGMQDYQSLLNKANASASIDGIVLIMDTPGGTVDGTPELGLAIKQSAKPVGIFGDGMVASAGMWLASQASVIIGNKNNPTEFGSIGVLMMLPNYQNVMDAGNYPNIKIYRASQSTEKALVNGFEPVSKEVEVSLQQDLDNIATAFISAVKAGRGDALDAEADGIFSGRMFDVYESKKIGLITAVGTLQTAINKVAELAKQNSKGTTDVKSNANTKMKFPKISALFGKSGKEATSVKSEEQESLATDQASMEAAEKTLADMEAENVQLKAQKETAEQKATQLEAKVTELTTQVNTLTVEKTTLSEKVSEQKIALDKKPTGHLTTVIPDDENESGQAADQGAIKTDDGNKYLTSVDATAAAIRKQNAKSNPLK